MRFFTGLLLTAALSAWGIAMAAEPAPLPAAGAKPPKPAPLQPGRSAGVHVAQQAHTGLALVGAGAIIAVVVIAAGTGGGNSSNGNLQPNSQSVTTTP
jgi:aromatic ring hydroxylase